MKHKIKYLRKKDLRMSDYRVRLIDNTEKLYSFVIGGFTFFVSDCINRIDKKLYLKDNMKGNVLGDIRQQPISRFKLLSPWLFVSGLCFSNSINLYFKRREIISEIEYSKVMSEQQLEDEIFNRPFDDIKKEEKK